MERVNQLPRARRTGVRTLEVGVETLVLDEQSGQIHQLNATASFVWRRCDGASSVVEIAGLLTREFDVDPATAAEDVARVITQLEELKLLYF